MILLRYPRGHRLVGVSLRLYTIRRVLAVAVAVAVALDDRACMHRLQYRYSTVSAVRTGYVFCRTLVWALFAWPAHVLIAVHSAKFLLLWRNISTAA